MKAEDRDDGYNEHQRVWEVLPWIVNGTADAEQTRLVERHLPACAECRAELGRERRMHAALALPPERTPDVDQGFARLLRRLDDGSIRSTRPQRRWPWRISGAGLLGIGLLEAVAFAALLVAGARLAVPVRAPAAASYRTLSEADRVAAPRASLRVVFDTARPLREFQALLQAHGLAVVDGPSEAGVWTVGFVRGAGDAEAVARDLRLVPGVLFAEPIGLPQP